MTDLPTGTVTFLFTDVESSTRLLEHHPAAYRAAVRRHHDLLRHAIEAHGGVVFETVGDAVYAAFAYAAVAAAVEGQVALHREHWGDVGEVRVRMGLHTGTVERDGAHYFGLPLYRCGRLMAAAHGGQVLLSEAAASLVRDALPAGVNLRDLGEHRLRDLARPERVFQLVIPGLLADFPPLRTLEARPHNLPAQRTPLIGREREVAAVHRLLLREGVRLVTLTGPGGSGKTRLALQAAAELLDDFDDGAFFVDLAPISDPALVASTAATALGLREVGQRPAPELVREHLRDKRQLLVLDNFEQVLPAVDLVGDLLEACPRLKVLVTSRAVLRLYGEHDYPVPPLTLPEARDPASLPPIERLAEFEAIRLFVERAQAAKADFALTAANAAAVAGVCRRVDGLPLAIELAASRVRLLPPEAMLARLAGAHGQVSLQLLTGGARDLPARQQALRATIAWSYGLLDATEQALFRWLGVFVGGCTLEAAEAVCAIPTPNPQPLSPNDVLETIESLADKSLLQQDVAAGEPRFRMLETVREFALEQLAAHGEDEAARLAHAAHFGAHAERAGLTIYGYAGEQGRAAILLEADHDNLRAALQFHVDRGAAGMALRLSGALWPFWYARGHFTEGRRWLEATLAMGGVERPLTRAKALTGAGILAHYQGDLGRAAALCGESLGLCRRFGDRSGIAAALHGLALVARTGGEFATARAMYDEAVVIMRDVGDVAGTAFLLGYQGVAAYLQGDFAAVRRPLEESLEKWRAVGDSGGAAMNYLILGYVAAAEGDNVTAERLCGAALDATRAAGRRRSAAQALWGLGVAALGQGRSKDARMRLDEGLSIFRELGDLQQAATCLDGLAGTAVADGQPYWAAQLLGTAEALRETIGAPVAPARRPVHTRPLEAARAALGEAAFATAFAEGRAMMLEDVLAAERLATDRGQSAPRTRDAERAIIRTSSLSRREREVAALVAQGRSNREIAAALVITPRTAETHVDHIMTKLGFSSRAQIAAWAVQHGLVAAQTA